MHSRDYKKKAISIFFRYALLEVKCRKKTGQYAWIQIVSMGSSKKSETFQIMGTRVAPKTGWTGGSQIPWQRAKESLSDVEFEKIFWICSSPDTAIVKKPFHGFSKILLYKISYEITSFCLFYPTKKSAKKIISFSGIPILTALHKNILRMRTTYFWFWFLFIAEARRVDEIKNSKSKIIL